MTNKQRARRIAQIEDLLARPPADVGHAWHRQFSALSRELAWLRAATGDRPSEHDTLEDRRRAAAAQPLSAQRHPLKARVRP